MKEILSVEGTVALERPRSVERYRPVMVGGRVKTAGVSFRYLYNAAAPLIAGPTSAHAAFETSKNFARLKDNPPFPFRAAFFPQDEGSMRAAFRGLGIYRPTIKTDQGPGGNVGHFSIDGQVLSKLTGRIIKEQGVALLEHFLQQRFGQMELSDEQRRRLGEVITGVQEQYQRLNYQKTFEAITAFRELAGGLGLETTRRAGVGREEFFFFRPVQTEQDIVIGRDLVDGISEKTKEVVGRVEHLASLMKRFVREGSSLKEAIKKAYEGEKFYSPENEGSLLYFQPDVLLRADGTFDIEHVNLPDLGMFLTAIETPVPNKTLDAIRDINVRIKAEVLDIVAQELGSQVMLLTRKEVLDNMEDTLEQLELQTVGQGLEERGVEIQITSVDSVVALPEGSTVLLFNITTEGEAFETLLQRVARGELRCFPDPFIKLFEKEATTFTRRKIDDPILERFLKVIAPGALDKPEGVHARYLTIQNALQRGGIDSDIVYFSLNGNGIQIPTFRYDVKTFFEVQKAVAASRRQGKDVTLTVTAVPFTPQDALIEGSDGPRLAVFRFMFVRN